MTDKTPKTIVRILLIEVTNDGGLSLKELDAHLVATMTEFGNGAYDDGVVLGRVIAGET